MSEPTAVAVDLDELERLARAATPGPYLYDGQLYIFHGAKSPRAVGGVFADTADLDEGENAVLRVRGVGARLDRDANGAFVAAAMNAASALVAEVRRLREALVSAEAAMTRALSIVDGESQRDADALQDVLDDTRAALAGGRK